ncbi:saccharopine dehydrogenase NADP-binding domain-containing protein [Umezawaea sp. Da 62-37]|uniref:saccharopine dehydrogenase NADP-binding domain-containing protein n=1 Tax=Umezawaea sp. Da 62-37 TaxID=3075927 RepID=UPI0028F715F5|nr:saccharopine dehydrogenase NADP-binding domain-containing protein [Umezawaea sp. Da 62-37]WNV86845.1 saccharopine dehydrogenase NADP-binding domain-containing protein [Umezawaea sp. Da 62-37]
MNTPNTAVAVMGAYGHTARFVLAALRDLGLDAIPVGRDHDRLHALGSRSRVASADDPASLDRAFDGVAAVVNCAGPFADTAVPVVEAALRAGAHYVDIAAEQTVTMDLLSRFDGPARQAGVAVVPSMAFYGGLGDLLASAALGDWPAADDVRIAIALNSWRPTEGTRRTVSRNSGRHVVFTDHRFVPAPTTPTTVTWRFPDPIGEHQLTGLSSADHVTIAHHLPTPRIGVHINTGPLADLADPTSPPPVPADALGRSAQTFHVEAVVTKGAEHRRASASGHDIYAISGPLAAGAVAHLLTHHRVGALTAGALLDPVGFLRSLDPVHLSFAVDG